MKQEADPSEVILIEWWDLISLAKFCVAEMHIDDENQFVEVPDAVYIPLKAKQFIYNWGTDPLIFICIVDPAWRKEDETIFQ